MAFNQLNTTHLKLQLQQLIQHRSTSGYIAIHHYAWDYASNSSTHSEL